MRTDVGVRIPRPTTYFIEEAEHWRYSSAKDYMGIEGLLKVERLW